MLTHPTTRERAGWVLTLYWGSLDPSCTSQWCMSVWLCVRVRVAPQQLLLLRASCLFMCVFVRVCQNTSPCPCVVVVGGVVHTLCVVCVCAVPCSMLVLQQLLVPAFCLPNRVLCCCFVGGGVVVVCCCWCLAGCRSLFYSSAAAAAATPHTCFTHSHAHIRPTTTMCVRRALVHVGSWWWLPSPLATHTMVLCGGVVAPPLL